MKDCVIQPNDAREFAEAALAIGLFALDGEDADVALECFDEVLALFPEDIPTLNRRGVALLTLGDLNEAAVAFERALELAPEFHPARANLAAAQRLSGELEPASESFEAYLRDFPDDARTHFSLGMTLAERGQVDHANDALRRAVAKFDGGDAEEVTMRGIAHLRLEDPESAHADFESARELDPEFLPALYYLGASYLGAGDAPRAIEQLESLVQDQPAFPGAAIALGVAYRCAGEAESSVEVFRALESADRGASSALRIHLRLALSDLERNDAETESGPGGRRAP